MLQRRKILQALAPPKGARAAASKKTLAFVEKVLSQPGECRWEDMVEAFRRDYYDLVDEVVPRLIATDDPFILANLANFLDPKKPSEKKALETIVKSCDAEKHQVILQEVVQRVPKLKQVLKRRKELPELLLKAVE